MLRKLAAVALCVSSLVFASDKTIAAKHLLASSQRYNVTHDGSNFKVNGQRVHDYDVDASLRKPGSIRELFKSNRSKLEVNRIGRDYAISRHDQLKGGGPNFGYFVYWATKTVCYGCMGGAAAVGATAVATVVLPASAPAAVSAGVGYAVGVGAPAALTSSTGVGLVAVVAATSPTVVKRQP